MHMMIWGGAALSLVGLAGILWSVLAVTRARRAGLGEEQMRTRLQQIMPVNLGALMLSILGLGVVAVGIILS